MMHLVLEAYANIGDTAGAENVFERMQTMGLTPTSDTINIILKSIVNSMSDLDWDAITFCYSEYFGFQKFVADMDTYSQLMAACEKYNRQEQAIFWFNEILSVGLHVTPAVRDTFKRILGDSQYSDFCEELIPQFRDALSNVDMKTKPFPGRHTADSIVAERNEKTEARKSTKQNITRENAPTNQDLKLVNVERKTPTISSVRAALDGRAEPGIDLKKKHAPKPVKILAKWIPTLKSLKELGAIGDVGAVKTKVEELIAEGSIPSSVLLEHLLYAHQKAYDTKGAQRVIDEMKSSNIDISEKSYYHLVSSYSNDGDGAGAQKAASEAATYGYPTG